MKLRPKTYSYLKDVTDENKNAKGPKKCAMKQKRKFEQPKTCLEATQLGNGKNELEKHEVAVTDLKEDHKEFIKNNRVMLKSQ